MKKSVCILCLICLLFSFQGCNQSVTNQQAATNSSIEKEEVNTKDISIGERYANSKDTTVNIGNKQIYEKIEITNIEGKFIEQKGVGDNGKELIQKVPDTEIKIQISNYQYKIQKQEVPGLDNDFLKQSVFQQINFHSITEEVSIFEITLGEPDTDNIIFVFLTIDSKGGKSFKVEYPEWDEE